jgi:hypothetical protein
MEAVHVWSSSAEFEKIRAVAGDFVAGAQRQIDEFTRRGCLGLPRPRAVC